MEAILRGKLQQAHLFSDIRDAAAEQLIIEVLQQAMELCNHALMADAYIELADFQLRQKFNFQKALEYSLVAKDFIKPDTPLNTQVNVYSSVGKALQRLRDYIGAQQNYLHALELSERIENPDSRQLEIRSYLHYYMAVLNSNIGMYDFAAEFLAKAKQGFEKTGLQKGMLICNQLQASYYYQTRDYDAALHIYEGLIEANCDVREQWLEVALDYAGQIYFLKEQYDRAEEYLLRAYRVRKEIGDELRFGHTYFSMAKLCYRTKRIEEGDEYFARLRELILKYPYFYSESLILEINWELYGERGDFETSYSYYKQVKVPSADPGVLEHMMKQVLENERDKQQQALLQAKELEKLNQEMSSYARQLESNNKDLKTYAHATSHDLREPLRMVSAYMTILESKIKGKLSAEERQFLHFAVDGSKRMDEMITRILHTAKGGATILKPVDLNRIIEQVSSNLTRLMSEKNAEIEAEKLPVIIADDIQLLQVFQNLITNAIKYNTSAVPSVKVTAVTTDGKHIVSVADNGVGIPEEKRTSVFDMFSRVENESGAEGTGIGLSTVKGIIEKLNGQISIESNELGGTVFNIYFPAY
jgi:signal transduction histidine kinase